MGTHRQGVRWGVSGWNVTKETPGIRWILAEGRPGWSHVAWGHGKGWGLCYQGRSDIEDERFWLTWLSRILAKIEEWKDKPKVQLSSQLGERLSQVRIQSVNRTDIPVTHCFLFFYSQTISSLFPQNYLLIGYMLLIKFTFFTFKTWYSLIFSLKFGKLRPRSLLHYHIIKSLFSSLYTCPKKITWHVPV